MKPPGLWAEPSSSLVRAGRAIREPSIAWSAQLISRLRAWQWVARDDGIIVAVDVYFNYATRRNR